MIAINLLTFFEDGINLVESIYTWNSQDWCPVVKIYQLTIYGKKKNPQILLDMWKSGEK